MLVPSPVRARANELTKIQRCELDDYFERHADHEENYREPLLLALVLAGDKPAADISPASFAFPDHPWTPHRGLLELCDLFGLSYRHDESINGYEQAIETGKIVRERFSELADVWDLSELDTIAAAIYDDALRTFNETSGSQCGESTISTG